MQQQKAFTMQIPFMYNTCMVYILYIRKGVLYLYLPAIHTS